MQVLAAYTESFCIITPGSLLYRRVLYKYMLARTFRGGMVTEKTLEAPDFLELLQGAVEEEHWFLQAHQNRVAFYTSFISAILAVTIAGVLEAADSIHYAILVTGPLTVFAISVIALDGTYRFYQRFLEAVTIRAKLEQAIGITDADVIPKNPPGYWKEEPVVPPRHLDARLSISSSSDFINQHKFLGYQRATRRLFRFFQAVSILLGLTLIALAIGLI
jgi:hypothetical protein